MSGSSYILYVLAVHYFLCSSQRFPFFVFGMTSPHQNPIITRKMQQPSYLKLPNEDHIAYHSTNNNSKKEGASDITGVIFCCGFRSSMNGNKALALEEYCRSKLNLGFTRFDYRGHGHGEECLQPERNDDNSYFQKLGLSDWIEDACAILKHVVQNHNGGRQIIVGSSMGAWIAIHVALKFPQHVAGIVGIAAAPDFTRDIWNGISDKEKEQLKTEGRILLPSEYSDHPYPISLHLIEDGNQWLLLNDNNHDGAKNDKKEKGSTIKLNPDIPVRLIHGQKDTDISWKKSVALAGSISHDDVLVTLIKSGDHRLSTPRDLRIILRVLGDLIDSTDMDIDV